MNEYIPLFYIERILVYKSIFFYLKRLTHSLLLMKHHSIMSLNSSKLRTPSPFTSNCLSITPHSSTLLDSPSLLSILFKLLGVIHPLPSISYIPKASLNSFIFLSSSSLSIHPTNSSNPTNPSPSESIDSTTSRASSISSSSPIDPTQRWSSQGESFPSPSSSKRLKMSSYTLQLIMAGQHKNVSTANVELGNTW